MRKHVVSKEEYIRSQLWDEQGKLCRSAVAISIEEDTIEWTRQTCYDLSCIPTFEINHFAQSHVTQIRIGQRLLMCITVNADHLTTVCRGSPGEPDRTIAVGGANLEQPRTPGAANEDVQEPCCIQFKVQHFLASLLLPGIILFSAFIQFIQESTNFSISH